MITIFTLMHIMHMLQLIMTQGLESLVSFMNTFFLLLLFALFVLIFMLLKQTIRGKTSQTIRGTHFILENLSSGPSMARCPTPSWSMYTQGMWSLPSVCLYTFFGATQGFWWGYWHSWLPNEAKFKTSAINKGLHANSFCKMSEFIYSTTPCIIWIYILYEFTHWDSLNMLGKVHEFIERMNSFHIWICLLEVIISSIKFTYRNFFLFSV